MNPMQQFEQALTAAMETMQSEYQMLLRANDSLANKESIRIGELTEDISLLLHENRNLKRDLANMKQYAQGLHLDYTKNHTDLREMKLELMKLLQKYGPEEQETIDVTLFRQHLGSMHYRTMKS
jgi:t-SNARE complex subunit (syntaxin)